MREDILGPKYRLRLGDLRPWHVLRVSCFRCSRTANLKPAPLLRRYGEHRCLTEIERKLACTACGNRTWNFAKVFRLDRNV